jgi:hypothetical protein
VNILFFHKKMNLDRVNIIHFCEKINPLYTKPSILRTKGMEISF